MNTNRDVMTAANLQNIEEFFVIFTVTLCFLCACFAMDSLAIRCYRPAYDEDDESEIVEEEEEEESNEGDDELSCGLEDEEEEYLVDEDSGVEIENLNGNVIAVI